MKKEMSSKVINSSFQEKKEGYCVLKHETHSSDYSFCFTYIRAIVNVALPVKNATQYNHKSTSIRTRENSSLY